MDEPLRFRQLTPGMSVSVAKVLHATSAVYHVMETRGRDLDSDWQLLPLRGLLLWFGRDGEINVSTSFELHIVAMLIS